jgi:hypothetical protein
MYNIAGLNVSILNGGGMFDGRARAYSTEDTDTPDISIEVTQAFLIQMRSFHPHLTEDECAYIFTGEDFGCNLIDYGGFKLHASAVVLDRQAYLFSAPSGIGKSTHTSLWCSYFGPERAFILNDDAPIIRRTGDTYSAWGSPWSGTSSLNRNTGVPLKAIAFLERSNSDWIRPMDRSQSIIRLMDQTRMTRNQERMEKLICLLEGLLMAVPIYQLGCTPQYSAVLTAYSAMKE